MQDPWVPEREVDPVAAARAVARHVPGLEGATAREVGRGWDNVVIAVDHLYLRVAVRRVAEPLLRRERQLLPLLADLPLPVPQPLAWGEAQAGLPGPWMVYAPVPGVELAAHLAAGGELTDPAALGRFLAALHHPKRLAGAGFLPLDPHERSVPEALAERVATWLAQAEANRLEVPSSAILSAVEDTELGPVHGTRAIVHGDLHLQHVLVDAGGLPTGVIDWGDAARAVPVADLGVYWCGLTPLQREAFLAAYGEVDPTVLAAARRFALFSCLAMMVASHRQGQPTLVAAAREGLTRSLTA